MSPISIQSKDVVYNPSFRLSISFEQSECIATNALTNSAHVCGLEAGLIEHIDLCAQLARAPVAEAIIVSALGGRGLKPDSAERALGILKTLGVLVSPENVDISLYSQIWDESEWGDVANYLLSTIDEEYIEGTRAEDWRAERCETYKTYSEDPTLPPPPVNQSTPTDTINLEYSKRPVMKPYFQSILGRRTARTFADTLVDATTFGDLLYYSFWQTRTTRREAEKEIKSNYAAFSKSHLGIFECLVSINHVAGLAQGLYRYNISDHSLTPQNLAFPETAVRDITIGMPFTRDCAFSLFLLVDYYRSMWRYRTSRKYRTIFTDAARQAQQVIIAAESLGLGTFMTPAIIDELAEVHLGTIPLEREAVYYLAVGHVP